MKVTLDREGQNLVKLALELESDKAIRAYEQTCRQISLQANIPGFRKGKAPRNVVEKTFGVEYIKQEALERLVPQLLSEAITKESLELITEPEINDCHFNLGEPLTLNAKFEVRPPVTLGDYKDIKVSVPKAERTKEDLDFALANLAESRAEVKPIASRPIAMGDHVLVNFECFVEDKLVDGGKAQGLLLEMKEGSFLDGFCEQLVDCTVGDHKELKARFPEAYRNRQLAGKDAVFKTDIKELRQKVTPAIDDQLAVAFGYDSLDKLKEAVSDKLDDEVEQENQLRKHRAVIESIVKSSKVEIPESMIKREVELLISQMKAYAEQNGQSFEELEKTPEFEAMKTAKHEEAKQRVLASLVLGAIVKEEKISVNDREIADHFAEVIDRYQLVPEKAFGNEALRRQVMEEVLTSKVIDLIVDKAQVDFTADSKDSHTAKEGPSRQEESSTELVQDKSEA